MGVIMKRIVYYILTVLLGLSCLVACQGGDAPSTSSEQTSSSETKETNNLHITTNEVILSVGEFTQLVATLDIENAYIFWSVRDENIATISSTGVVTGVSEGETICYASFAGESAMCLVKVLPEVAQPMLSVSTPYQDGITIFEGSQFNLLLSVKLGDNVLSDATLQYEVSDTDVVEVVDGILVARAVGEATVTIKAIYGTQEASVSLVVGVVNAIS
jgi:hypothetical protein